MRRVNYTCRLCGVKMRRDRADIQAHLSHAHPGTSLHLYSLTFHPEAGEKEEEEEDGRRGEEAELSGPEECDPAANPSTEAATTVVKSEPDVLSGTDSYGKDFIIGKRKKAKNPQDAAESSSGGSVRLKVKLAKLSSGSWSTTGN